MRQICFRRSFPEQYFAEQQLALAPLLIKNINEVVQINAFNFTDFSVAETTRLLPTSWH